MDDNCIFCKLANGVYATKTLYEDAKFRVILDASPATRGHALIIPKEHYADIYQMPEELTADAFLLAKKMIITLTEKLACEGFNIVQNNGELAGQTVFHFHIHLIPRYREDNQKINWKPGSPSEEELEEIKNSIIS